MQHLNDDMDELFRKAADDYPLNTGTPDWSRVAAGLTQVVPDRKAEPKRRYRRFLWLLLLIPVGLVISEMINPVLFKNISGKESLDLQKRVPETDANGVSGKENASSSAPDATDDNASRTANQLSATAPGPSEANASRSEEVVANPDKQEKNTAKDPDPASHKSIGETTILSPAIKSRTEFNGTKGGSSLSGNRSGSENRSGSASRPGSGNRPGNGSRQGATGTRTNTDPSTKNGIAPNTGSQTNTGSDSKIDSHNDIAKIADVDPSADTDPSSNIDPYTRLGLATVAAPDTKSVPARDLTEIQIGPIGTKNVKSRNFYLGVIGGLDITTVRLQETSKTGSHFGAIAGYSFAKKWSVEVGFIVERKYYYTDGKYFDRSKLNLNANTTVISVDGECKMWEIPVSVKYDITNNYRSNFFVTGGLSSYIMKEEDYSMVWGYASGSRSTHYYPYKNSSKNFFAEIRLTGGYALKLPKQFSVRIEPYLNIPVTGVGYGKLNLMSAGVNAGIFRRIF